MGAAQLSGVLSSITRSSAASRGNKVDEAEVARKEEQFRARVEEDGSVWRTSAAGLDDGVIDPRDTREVLSICLDVVTKDGVQGWQGMNGVSRL